MKTKTALTPEQKYHKEKLDKARECPLDLDYLIRQLEGVGDHLRRDEPELGNDLVGFTKAIEGLRVRFSTDVKIEDVLNLISENDIPEPNGQNLKNIIIETWEIY